ncbi:MAG: hypothetical protein IE931_12045 [Sphingobacteriales bacterium]|nr:hypothetical protein [Sphingobacteriales bacterium]
MIYSILLYFSFLYNHIFSDASKIVSKAKSNNIIAVMAFSWCEPCRADLEMLFTDPKLKINSFIVLANPNFEDFLREEKRKHSKVDINVFYLPDSFNHPNMRLFKDLTHDFNKFYQTNEDIIGPGYLFVINRENNLLFEIPKNENLGQIDFKKWQLAHLKRYFESK